MVFVYVVNAASFSSVRLALNVSGNFGSITLRFLSRNTHNEGVNLKHPNFVLSSIDTSIKMTVLPLTYAVHPWSEHCECSLMQK